MIDGRIWLASMEMALAWIGYIEGAIEAAERFASHFDLEFGDCLVEVSNKQMRRLSSPGSMLTALTSYFISVR